MNSKINYDEYIDWCNFKFKDGKEIKSGYGRDGGILYGLPDVLRIFNDYCGIYKDQDKFRISFELPEGRLCLCTNKLMYMIDSLDLRYQGAYPLNHMKNYKLSNPVYTVDGDKLIVDFDAELLTVNVNNLTKGKWK